MSDSANDNASAPSSGVPTDAEDTSPSGVTSAPCLKRKHRTNKTVHERKRSKATAEVKDELEENLARQQELRQIQKFVEAGEDLRAFMRKTSFDNLLDKLKEDAEDESSSDETEPANIAANPAAANPAAANPAAADASA